MQPKQIFTQQKLVSEEEYVLLHMVSPKLVQLAIARAITLWPDTWRQQSLLLRIECC